MLGEDLGARLAQIRRTALAQNTRGVREYRLFLSLQYGVGVYLQWMRDQDDEEEVFTGVVGPPRNELKLGQEEWLFRELECKSAFDRLQCRGCESPGMFGR